MAAALSITGSSVVVAPSGDGRSWIVETQQVSDGSSLTFQYLADAGANPQAIATARASLLPAAMAIAEIADNIEDIESDGSLAQPTFSWSTAPQNAATLRLAYQTATDRQAIMIGDFLNSLTDAQLETAFGLGAAQVATLRTNKLGPAATLAASIRSAAGQ